MSYPKKTLIGLAVAAGLGASSLLGLTVAQAAANEPGSSLIDRITERFSLNHDEVQVVFDEFNEERRAEHQQKIDERLQQAVAAGKITEEQRTLIIEKQAEMHEFMESLKDKTPEERKEALKQKHEELKDWAEQNDIPLPFAGPFGQKGHGHIGPRGLKGGTMPHDLEGEGQIGA